MGAKQESNLGLQLLVITICRLFINTSLRMVYPFLPEIARGVGVSTIAVSRLVSLRSFAGFVSPLFGPLSERFGRRPVMVGSMIVMGLGCFVVGLWPAYWPLGITLVVISLAKVIFDPAMQAYLGDVVPYAQRGRAIAITEFSWAGGLLLGAPVVGFIIARQGWQAPFFWLGVASVAGAAFLWRVLPTGDGRTPHATTLLKSIGVIRRQPVIWAAAAYALLAMMANEMLFINYGGWMESSFTLSLTSLGLAAGVIGGAEILGEVLAGWSVDRWGKRPVILIAGFFNILTYLVIPFADAKLFTALAVLFALFLSFEITVVGGVPLLTELLPQARSVVMSTVIAASSLGRALGSLIGPELWLRGGFTATALASAGLMVLAMTILALWVREGAGRRD